MKKSEPANRRVLFADIGGTNACFALRESYLQDVPTRFILDPDRSFIGLNAFFERSLGATNPSSLRGSR